MCSNATELGDTKSLHNVDELDGAEPIATDLSLSFIVAMIDSSERPATLSSAAASSRVNTVTREGMLSRSTRAAAADT
jgi:hypothetical protein